MHISISFDLPLPGLRSGGVLELYRLATLLPTFWLAMVQCQWCGGHAFHFGVAVATMVVAVATCVSAPSALQLRKSHVCAPVA
jgi:hypothetical protein